jgi:hypothetical protein
MPALTAPSFPNSGQGRHQVRRVVEQTLALGQVLVDQAVLPLLQIAEATVDQLGRLRRRARGEVVLLDQRRPQSPAGGIERHPGPGDAASDDQHIERLVGQALQGGCSIEPACARLGDAGWIRHGQSLPQVGTGLRPAAVSARWAFLQ